MRRVAPRRVAARRGPAPAVLVLLAIALAAGAAAADGPAGAGGAAAPLPTALFGMSWGDPVSAGMVRLEVKVPPGYAMYKRPTDRLELSGVPVREIQYVFQNGRLDGLNVVVDAAQRAALEAALSRSWGASRQKGTTADVEWNAPTLHAVLGPVAGGHLLMVFPR